MEFFYRRSYRGGVKAVIFDWAGTTVDYGSFAPTMVFLRLFENQGVTITPEEARSGMGLMKKDHLKTILTQERVAQAWKTTHGQPPNESDVDNLFNNFIPMQTNVLVDYAVLIPGVLDVVNVLREQGIKIGSTTGYIRSMME
jgi:phosphonoacetaldehyde hydrolase